MIVKQEQQQYKMQNVQMVIRKLFKRQQNDTYYLHKQFYQLSLKNQQNKGIQGVYRQ